MKSDWVTGKLLDDELAHGLVEAAPDALVVISAAGRIVFLNAQGELLTGYRRAELIGQPIEVFLPAGLVAAHIAQPPDARRCWIGAECPVMCRRRDGSLLAVEVSLSSIRTQAGQFIAATLRDVSARHQVEQELRESEERFRLTLDEAPIGMALVDLDGRFLRVNRALCQLVGYAAAELTGLTFQAITHPDDLDIDLALIEQLTRGDIPHYQLAKRYFRKDGAVVDVILSVSIVRDVAGQPRHYISQIEDITERKRAVEALRRSEQSLAHAQQVAHLGSSEWDLVTNEVTRSAEAHALFGVESDPKYRPAWSLIDHVHPEDREGVMATVNSAVREGRGYSVEYRIVRPDGSVRFILAQGEMVLEQGRPVRVVATMLDITERKRAEREREKLLRWLNAVLEQCPVGLVLLLGPHGEQIQANTHALALFGRVPELTDRTPGMLIGPDEQPLLPENFPSARALRGERVESFMVTLRNAHGELIPILGGAVPIFDVEGVVEGAVVVMQDITVLKQLDRLRAEWNSIIAHDLRQPLHTISLCTQMISRRKADLLGLRPPLDLRAPLEKITASVMRLSRMVSDLLDLSRLEVHQLTLERQLSDVVALLHASVERFALEAPSRRFLLRSRGPIPSVAVDTDRIAQVMDNLLSNALKYGEPDTPIEIEVEADGAAVTVAVTNAGKGIAAEELQRLFQRFRRTEEARRGSVQGVGLGLYIVCELVKAHGGHIEATSTPGGSTTFRFTLPLPSEPAPAA